MGDVNSPQSIPATNARPEDIPISEQYFGQKRKLRIALAGAGISALSFFHFAEEKLENVDIVCYEKNHDVGGTVSLSTSPTRLAVNHVSHTCR
jgi:NAD(P)-binding Rossmann-like domain